MARSARSESTTKTRLLDAAEGLMLAKGFGATSVEEICHAAKLTKGSFFHYFDSKERLGRELLARFCSAGRQLHQSCCGNERDPLKRVYRYIDAAARLAQDSPMSRGCLLGGFSQELCDTHPGIRSACEQGFDAWAKQFTEELTRAKAQYAPKASFKPRELAEYFIAILEGSLILGKTRNNMSVVAQNLRHFKAYVQTRFTP